MVDRKRGSMEGSRTGRDKGKRRRVAVHERDQERSEGFIEPHSMRNQCCSSQAYIKVGIVSDTHGCFDERLRDIFEGVHEIWHGGDHAGKNGSYQSAWDVLKELNNIAPVTCMVRGNVDTFAGGIRGVSTSMHFDCNNPHSIHPSHMFCCLRSERIFYQLPARFHSRLSPVLGETRVAWRICCAASTYLWIPERSRERDSMC